MGASTVTVANISNWKEAIKGNLATHNGPVVAAAWGNTVKQSTHLAKETMDKLNFKKRRQEMVGDYMN